MKINRFFRLYLSYFLPILSVVVFLGGGATIISRYTVNRNLEENARGQLRQITTYYETILDEMEALTLQFSSNTEIKRSFNSITAGEGVNYNEYRESRIIEGFINAVMNSHQYIDAVYIYIDNPNSLILDSRQGFMSLERTDNTEWIEAYMASKHEDRNSSASFGDFLRISRPITNSLGKQIGVIILDLKKDFFSRSIVLPNNAILRVCSREGETLFTSGIEEQKAKIFSDCEMEHDWLYYLAFPKKDLYYTSNLLLSYTLVLTVAAIFLTFLLTRRTHRKEMKFLMSLMKKFNQNPDRDELENYTDVYDYVNYHIIKTFIEGDYLKLQKETAEYRALQLQLNPHFLFNTLDTIYWKAMRVSKGTNDVSSMIELLGKLLQYALQADLNGIELEEELEQSRRYLAIQKYRFPDRFAVREDIDPSLLSVRVPCMLLEPLLENVFTHAFSSRKFITIGISIEKKEDGTIEIRITNDGKGLTGEEIEKLNRKEENILVKKKSMGIANTRKRLELFYRGKAEMKIQSTVGNSVEVLIRLPSASDGMIDSKN